MSDLIYRQAAIDALRDYLIDKRCPDDGTLTCRLIENKVINKLPSAQPDGIPLEWINKHLEWLDNCNNDLAQRAKAFIMAMVETWKEDRI